MGRRLRLPGPRSCPATLDEPGTDGDSTSGRSDAREPPACVVACPPHPQLGGRRSDARLTAVSDALTDRGLACLRFDYGPWDEGRGERTDAANALAWAREHYAMVGLFGYSFGAGVALCAASAADDPPGALSVLAPPARIGETDVARCLDSLALPVQVVVGERDVTVDSGPVANRARERDDTVEVFPGDHHFVGQTERLGECIAAFLTDALHDDT